MLKLESKEEVKWRGILRRNMEVKSLYQRASVPASKESNNDEITLFRMCSVLKQ